MPSVAIALAAERVARRRPQRHAGVRSRARRLRACARSAPSARRRRRPRSRPIGGQAQVGVVLAQLQPVFGARGEHAVRLGGAVRDQVVDQHAEVGLVAARRPGLALLHEARGVEAGEQALRRGLLVAGGAVDLAGEEQARDRLGLQRRLQPARIEVVVLDRVAGAGDVRAARSRGSCAPAPAARRTAARSRCRWDRSRRRRGLRARRRSGARPCRRSAPPCPRSTGSSAGRRLRSGRCTAASGRSAPRMMSCVRSLVWVIQHGTWRGWSAALPMNENTGRGSSPGCSSITE